MIRKESFIEISFVAQLNEIWMQSDATHQIEQGFCASGSTRVNETIC